VKMSLGMSNRTRPIIVWGRAEGQLLMEQKLATAPSQHAAVQFGFLTGLEIVTGLRPDSLAWGLEDKRKLAPKEVSTRLLEL
jgi:hypothetical protein